MSFFEDASLVLIPSGYKASKVYSVKPTDGTGDLTFTRSLDTATRVGPDGLIEKVRTNLVLHSEDFTNAYYTKIFANVTANTIANPVNGAITADTITPTADNDVHRLRLSPTGLSAIVHTFSIFVKANGYNFVRVIENTTTGNAITFNLSNGTIDSGSLGGQIVALGNGFFRCSTQMVVAASQVIDVQIQETSGTQSFVGNGTSGIFAFGAQLETGDIATPYIPTTTAAVSVGMLANVPRLDYTGGGCPKLLLEPQRVNLSVFSEQLNNGAWLKGGATISANVATSPAGFVEADKLVEDSSTGDHRVLTNTSVSLSTTIATTYSIFAKAAERTQIFVQDNDLVGARFNLTTGVVISTEGTATATITDFGNGWFRCTITRISSNGTGRIVVNLDNGTGSSYTGNGTSGVLLFGAQIENASAYATSYIPTLGAAVTRSADAASKTGISALIGQTEGTLFAEFDAKVFSQMPSSSEHRMTMVSDDTNNNRILVDFIVTSGGVRRIGVNVISGNVSQANLIFNTAVDKVYKIATAYKTNDFTLFVDGVERATDVSGVTFSGTTLSRLDVGQDRSGTLQQSNPINQALLFKTRLSNAALAELTA